MKNLLNSKEHSISLKTLIITMDADDNEKGALEKIKDVLKSNNLPIPADNKDFLSKDDITVGIYVMPGTGQGMLETLCLESIVNKPIMKCIDSFMDCLKKLSVKPKEDNSNIIEKAKVKAYLASLPNDCRSLGEAAIQSHWDFADPSFAELKNFLLKILPSQTI